jgi:trypsin-like peptidase
MHRRRAAARCDHRRAFLLLTCIAAALAPGRAQACEDRAVLAHAAVGITRMFDASEKQRIDGVAGSGWFLSPRLLVTVAHVAHGMRLSERDWKPVVFRDGDATEKIDVRLQRIVGTGPEKIALIEMAAPLGGARSLTLRKEPLTAEEPVISRAYLPDRVRTAQGRFVAYGTQGQFAGGALFEIYDGNDRMALDYGASGAPVLDCSGRVVAVVANLLTQVIGGQVRVSTAWSMPNVLTVPVSVLHESGVTN